MGSLLLALVLPLAVAADAIAVLPPDVDPARIPALATALAERGHPDATLLSADDFAHAFAIERVEGLPDADECDRRVPIEDWRRRFDAARGQFQLLAFTEGLAALVALDVELVCLSSPPATSDLFRLELAFAEAHAFLAQSAGRDDGKRAFHQAEADAALARAAAFGASLSVPADVPPEVLAAYERVRARSEVDLPRVVVAGPGARVGARFNGRPLPDGPFDAVVGTNLVQAADGTTVTAAARLRLTGGRTLVWLAPEEEGPLGTDVAGALANLDGTGPGATLLAAAAKLVGDGAEVLYLTERGGKLSWWRAAGPGDGAVALVEARPERAPAGPVDTWRVAIGAGPVAGWTNLGNGPLEGLGGPNAGVAVYGRVAVNGWLALAATVDPWAVAAPIPDQQGGGTLFRATIPAKVGVRFGPHTRRLAFEGGVDAGIHSFGRFPEGGAERERMSFFAAGAVGMSGALGPRVAARVQGWFGAGVGYLGAGGTVGLEGRL